MHHHRHTNSLNSRATGTVIDWKVGMSAAEQSISVKAGEAFTFKWTGSHNVYQFLSEAAYKACDFSGAKFVSDRSFTMKLGGSGTVYFGCKVGSHCRAGQKVAVTIAGTGNDSCAGALSTPRMVGSVFLSVLWCPSEGEAKRTGMWPCFALIAI